MRMLREPCAPIAMPQGQLTQFVVAAFRLGVMVAPLTVMVVGTSGTSTCASTRMCGLTYQIAREAKHLHY